MLSYIRGIPKLVKNGRYEFYVLEDVEIRTYRPKTDIAKELLNEYEPLDLLAYALGYRPTPEVKALILPRILPLFTTNEDTSGTHILSLTSPGLGKSECARILSELAQAYFSPFFPATTKLIGDARTNTYGLAYHYNTIYVDEFLHGESANNLKDNYNAILTGMENAKWSRERGQIDYERTVSFALFSNIKDESLKEYNISTFSNNQREIVEGILRDKLKIDTIDALMQRLTYVEYLIVKDYQIMQDLNRDENGNVLYLDPSISRGIIKILAENVLKSERLKKNPKDRYERHINRLYVILKALGVDIDEETVERLVYGDTTFWDIRHELFKSKSVESPSVGSSSKTVEESKNVQVKNDDDNKDDIKAKNLELARALNAKAVWIKGERHELKDVKNNDSVEDMDFSMESALGIERETIEDFFNNSNEVKIPVDGGFIEYKVEIPGDAHNDAKNEIEYVTIEITEDLGERDIIVGIDGKIYKLEKDKRISLPYENAKILIKHNVAKAIHPPDFVIEAETLNKYVTVWFTDCPHAGSFCNGKRYCGYRRDLVKEDECRSCYSSFFKSECSKSVSEVIV